MHHSQRGAIGHHAQVASHGDFCAAAQRRPFDGGDRRHRDRFQTIEGVGHDRRQSDPVEAGEVSVQFEQVAAGAERAAGTGDEQRPQIGGGLGLFNSRAELVHRLPRQRVARLRALDRDLTDPFFHHESDERFHHRLLDRLRGGPYTDPIGV